MQTFKNYMFSDKLAMPLYLYKATPYSAIFYDPPIMNDA